MIKFFRKIRQQLLSQNKFSKYMFYAIGEIILVVIGILIALKVNNWNVKQNNKTYEQQILKELKKEFEDNLDQLQEKQILRNFNTESTKWIINFKYNSDKNVNIDSINHHLSRTLIVPSYDPRISITNQLINSGNLQLIENSELRSELTKWPSVINDFVNEEKQFVTFMFEYYYLFLIDHYQLSPLVNELQNDDEMYKVIMSKKAEFSLNNLGKNEEIDQLLNHKDFEDYLSLILGFCNLLNNATNNMSDQNRAILQIIEAEIKD